MFKKEEQRAKDTEMMIYMKDNFHKTYTKQKTN